MADRFRGVSERTVDLALAVNPVDARTGRSLREAATVSIAGVRAAPVLNPSGYWLFLEPPVELPEDPVAVRVDPPARYVERTVAVDVGALSTPGVRVEIYPSTAYGFPPGTTLLEGTVEDEAGDPVADASVGIDGTNLETRTDAGGTFVLAVDGIAATESAEPDEILRVDPAATDPGLVQDYSQPGGAADPTITADHPDHAAAAVERAFREGERTTLESPIVLPAAGP